MKLKEQVCSLDLAKRLKELGVKQDAYFSWFQERKEETYEKWTYQKDVPWLLLLSSSKESISTNKNRFEHVIAAFTVAELGEMLPEKVTWRRTGVYWWPCNEHGDDVYWKQPGAHRKEADARAKMLVYLLENKLITL